MRSTPLVAFGATLLGVLAGWFLIAREVSSTGELIALPVVVLAVGGVVASRRTSRRTGLSIVGGVLMAVAVLLAGTVLAFLFGRLGE